MHMSKLAHLKPAQKVATHCPGDRRYAPVTRVPLVDSILGQHAGSCECSKPRRRKCTSPGFQVCAAWPNVHAVRSWPGYRRLHIDGASEIIYYDAGFEIDHLFWQAAARREWWVADALPPSGPQARPVERC